MEAGVTDIPADPSLKYMLSPFLGIFLPVLLL